MSDDMDYLRDKRVPELMETLMSQILAERPGDPYAGEAIFTARCASCHKLFFKGGNIGPSLVDIGKRFPANYLVESVLVPNRFVSPNFHPVTLEMNDGTVHVGFAEAEDSDTIGFRIITGQLISLAVKSVKKRDVSHQSMMPAGLISTPADMTDLLTFMVAKTALKKPKKGKR